MKRSGATLDNDLLGEAIVRKLARDEDPEQKISIEWRRPGKNRKDPPIIHNRWVLPSSLTKVRTSPVMKMAKLKLTKPRGTQHSLFGAMPDLAAHERERVVKMKPPEGPRGRQVEARTTKESKVPLAQRLREFPDQGLIDSNGKIFCAPCKEEIPNIKSSIDGHVKRHKHKNNLDKYQERSGDDGEVKEFLTQHFSSNPDESGTVLERLQSSISTATALLRCSCTLALRSAALTNSSRFSSAPAFLSRMHPISRLRTSHVLKNANLNS